jgi:hypothetical protein
MVKKNCDWCGEGAGVVSLEIREPFALARMWEGELCKGCLEELATYVTAHPSAEELAARKEQG